MNKLLPKYMINFILLQIVLISFVLSVLFADYFISHELVVLKIGIKSFTALLIIIYEVIINLYLKKAKKNYLEEKREKGYNEQFLWFEMLLLLDVLLLMALISQITESFLNISILIVIGFVLYYAISMYVKPYFGIKIKK